MGSSSADASVQIEKLTKQIETERLIRHGAQKLVASLSNNRAQQQQAEAKVMEIDRRIHFLQESLNSLTLKATHVATQMSPIDYIRFDTPYSIEKLKYRLKETSHRLELEERVFAGTQNLIEALTRNPSTDQNIYSELKLKIQESRARIAFLQKAEVDLKKLLIGAKQIVKDENEEEALHDVRVQRTGRLRIHLTGSYNIPRGNDSEINAVIQIDGNRKASTRWAKEKWNEQFDLQVDKAAEIELSVYDKSGPLLGFIWLKIVDLEEHVKKQKGEDKETVLDLIPSGQLFLTMSFEGMQRNTTKQSGDGLLRRQAVQKIYPKAGHKFVAQQFYQVMQCAVCSEFLVAGTGYQCSGCQFLCHAKCYNRVVATCSEVKNLNPPTFFNIPHRFALTKTLAPVWCSHCGYILPLGRQVMHCTECKKACHKEHAKMMPNFCKLTLELMDQVIPAIEAAERKREEEEIRKLRDNFSAVAPTSSVSSLASTLTSSSNTAYNVSSSASSSSSVATTPTSSLINISQQRPSSGVKSLMVPARNSSLFDESQLPSQTHGRTTPSNPSSPVPAFHAYPEHTQSEPSSRPPSGLQLPVRPPVPVVAKYESMYKEYQPEYQPVTDYSNYDPKNLSYSSSGYPATTSQSYQPSNTSSLSAQYPQSSYSSQYTQQYPTTQNNYQSTLPNYPAQLQQQPHQSPQKQFIEPQPQPQPQPKTPVNVPAEPPKQSYIDQKPAQKPQDVKLPPVRPFPAQQDVPTTATATGKLVLKAPMSAPKQKPPPPVKVSLDDFHLIAVLGRGAFGKVMMAEDKRTKQLYAIKALKKEFIIQNDDVKSTKLEKRVFQSASNAHHPFLVNLHSCFHTESRLYFVMEYVCGGDLMCHVQETRRFTQARAKFYACEVLLAVQFFHANNIIYRDLKLDNILMGPDGHIKVADYGICKDNMPHGSTTRTFCGTPDYMAPEILLNHRYGRAVDWWSFGVLIYVMLIGRYPFSGEDENVILEAILEDAIEYPSNMPKDTLSLLKGLLNKNPSKRLGGGKSDADEIKRHQYFNNCDWDAFVRKEIEPPWKPTLKHAKDVSNFDKEFTSEKPDLTPVESTLKPNEQMEFQGFSYMAEWAINERLNAA